MKLSHLCVVFFCVVWSASIHAQEIRIRVIDVHGKPITDECMGIDFWPSPSGRFPDDGSATRALTNKDGMVVLSLDKNKAVTEPVLESTCNHRPLLLKMPPTSISVTAGFYVSCQYSKKMFNDRAWSLTPWADKMPTFAIQDIIESGAVTTNTCSHLTPKPRPGELLFIVRKKNFSERFTDKYK